MAPLVQNPLNNCSRADMIMAAGRRSSAKAKLTDLLANNRELIKYLHATHDECDQHNDVATASLIENWIDETENRAWFLYEILHRA
jgi:DNA-binding ferritin-like protein